MTGTIPASHPPETVVLARLATFCYRKRWLVLALWVLALIGLNMASQNLSRVSLLTPGSPKEAIQALRQAFTNLSKDEDFLARGRFGQRGRADEERKHSEGQEARRSH